jgi:hypothetical protein
MSADLAVDNLEAAAGVGDLFAEAGSQLSEQVAVFASGVFGFQVELGDFAVEQRMSLEIKPGDVTLGVLDLTRDAETLGGGVFVGNGPIDFEVIVKQTLQRFGITAAVGLIGAGH